MEPYDPFISLAVSTSVSAISSSSSSFGTPQNAATTTTTVKDFCILGVELTTPPSKAETCKMLEVVEQTFNRVFCSNIDGTTTSWDDLQPHDKAKMAFLFLRGQFPLLHEHCKGNMVEIANMLLDSLDQTSRSGKRLHAYVRKGGDLTVPDEDGEHATAGAYEMFVRRFGEWLDPGESPSVFNNPCPFQRVAKPLIWLQEESSMVCYLVSVAIAIYYSQCIHNGTTLDDAPAAIANHALNVSRFMRDEFTSEEVFADIFKGEGGHPENTIKRLLEPKNPGKQVFRRTSLFLDLSVQVVFEVCQNYLEKYGGLVVERFKSFPGFDKDDGILVYHGDYAKLPKFKPSVNPNHALLIVGVRKTSGVDEMGGVAFLAQNTSVKKPFVVIGLDLLASMGVSEVLAIEPGLNFATGSWSHDSVAPSLIQSGSPSMVDRSNFGDFGASNSEVNDVALVHDDHLWERIIPNKVSHKIT